MKIALVAFNDLNICQYLYKYTEVLDKNGVEYDVLYWNRSGKEIADVGFEGKAISFGRPMNSYQSFTRKISLFLRYREFLKKTIIENGYDFLIILTSQTAVALCDLLLGEYSGRFIFDYRDLTFENVVPFYDQLIKTIVSNARHTFFSSPGFIDYLKIDGHRNISISHNSHHCVDVGSIKKKNEGTIRLSYWGMIRQVSHFCKVCDVFGHDNRYELVFHGEGRGQALKDYCSNNGISNVKFTGTYNYRKDIDRIASEADIINCIYENDRIMTPTLAVKLYDSLHYGIPIVVSKGSFIARFLADASFAIAVDLSEKTTDRIASWYQSLDSDEVARDFSYYRELISKDDRLFESKLIELVTTP